MQPATRYEGTNQSSSTCAGSHAMKSHLYFLLLEAGIVAQDHLDPDVKNTQEQSPKRTLYP